MPSPAQWAPSCAIPAQCLSFPSPSWDFSNYRHSRQAWRGVQVTSPSPQPWSPAGTLLAAAPPGETIKRQKGRAFIPEKTAREGCATSAAGHPFPPHRVLWASTGATGRWHDDGPHLEWASPLASRPHPCILCQPVEGFTARCRWPGSPPARGCHCRRHQQVLALSLFDPAPAAGRSAPRDRCLGQISPGSSGSGKRV